MLTLFLFLPAAAGLACVLLPKQREQDARWVALGGATIAFALAAIMYVGLDTSEGAGYQYVDRFTWIEAGDAGFEIQYFVGIDGLSATLVLLLGLLSFTAVLISFSVTERPREYYAWLLLLETAVAGVFVSLDLIQFFVFWELELLPMYLLISIWGSGRKEYSAMKFLLYTLAGSAFMLAGFLVLGFAAGSFDIEVLTANPPIEASVPLALVFWGIMAAFLVKLPVFPVHTWLPDAHTDAPTAVSVMLAGVLLKMGGYGILRIVLPILPEQAHDFKVILAAIAAFSIIYGAVITLQQKDLKRLVAYSSVSHMGFVLLGVSAMGAVGLSGAALQMFTHGTITGLLFVMVGLVYERTHTRQIADMSGLMHHMPLIGTVMIVAGLASLGLPGLSGFVAEVTTFLGAFDVHPAATIVSIFGVVLSAAYILWLVERVFHGPRDERWAGLTDANQWWEHTAMAALLIAIFAIGIYPAILTDALEAGLAPVAAIVEAAA